MNAKSGQHGYAGANPYGIFHAAHDDNDSTTTEGTTLTVAAPTVTLPGSTLGMGTTVSPEVSSAIAQLAANQAEMMRQMAALTIAPPPPIQQITIPTQQFTNGPGRRGGGGYNNSSGYGGNNYTGGTGGRGGGTPNNWGYNGGYTAGYNPQTGRGRTGRGRTYRNRRGRGSFVEAAGGIVPLGTPQGGPNPVKRFNNWNYCYSCGFDVEDGHTSMTCPQTWRRAGHQITCTRENYNQFLAAGHTPSIKAMHKNQLPPQGGF
jgi:hypothetical protein